MTAARSFPDALSTSRMPLPKRWEWLEAASHRSNLTSSNSSGEFLACPVSRGVCRKSVICADESALPAAGVLQNAREAFISPRIVARTGRDLHDFNEFADRTPASDAHAGR